MAGQRQAIERFIRDEIIRKTGLLQMELKEIREENQFIKKKLGQLKKRIEALEEATRERIREGSDSTDFGV